MITPFFSLAPASTGSLSLVDRLKRGKDGPVAIETMLGWVLFGPVAIAGQTDEMHSLVVHTLQISAPTPEMQSLDSTMKSFWDLESFVVPCTDRSLYDELRDTIVSRDGRYEVQFAVEKRHIPNNYNLSLTRLKGLLRQLKHNPDVRAEYVSMIKTQLQQGVAELVEDQSSVDIPGVHNLPHHAVIRRDKGQQNFVLSTMRQQRQLDHHLMTVLTLDQS